MQARQVDHNTAASPRAEIVVAVHDPARPIERAVASILTSAGATALVVVHNTDAAPILERLSPWRDDTRLRVIELHDGISSPSGPFNAGLDQATAPFVGIMGSDDELEPGAVGSWLALQHRTNARVVIARIAHAAPRRGIPTPPVRIPTRRLVHPVADRLSYRSAPLGIWDRARFAHLRFVPGVSAGEDIPFVAELWFAGAPIAFDARGPAYLVHADSDSRVSLSARPVSADVGYLPELEAVTGRLRLGGRQRDALVRKLLRVNVFRLIENRSPDGWTPSELADLMEATERVLALGSSTGATLSPLSIAEQRLVRALRQGAPVPELYRLLGASRRRSNPAALVPRNPLRILARDAPLRFGVASLWIAR